MTATDDGLGVTTLEFAGLPGSGKSHWASFAARELLQAGRSVQLPRESLSGPPMSRAVSKLGGAIAALAHEPRATARVLKAVAASQRSPIESVRRSVQWLDTQTRVRNSTRDGYLLLDEGPLQALWSIGLEGDADAVIDVLRAGAYSRAERAIVLVVPVEIAFSRARERPERHRRLDELPTDEARLAKLHEGARLLDHLVVRWRALHGEDAAIRIDAAQADAADRIRDLLALSSKA